MTRPLADIEADLQRSGVELRISKAAFTAYLFGVILGSAMGLCLGFLLGVYWHG